jgi:pSer/pThr/pTyr-binding forkhead associated (FHA) protein
LTLDDRNISRHHARIFYEKGKYYLEDIYSRQGTVLIHIDGDIGVYLPGRVWERWGAKFNARSELKHLDLFKIGSFWLQFFQ